MKMSNVVVLAVVGAAASVAMADGRVRITDATGIYDGTNGSGGAFTATTVSGSNGLNGGAGGSSTTFLTFCLERSENLSFGNTYFTQISDRAVAGGSNADPTTGAPNVPGQGFDVLSPVTALLYQTFRNGGSFGGVAPVMTSALTSALQDAIWYSEGELGSISGNALAMYNWARNQNPQSIGNVRVMRLWTSYSNGVYSGNAQDLLTIVPLPPAAFAGLGTLAGVIGMGYIRRRRLASI
jgi:hypothetical protein